RKRRNAFVPALGQFAGPHGFQFSRFLGKRLGVFGEFSFPAFTCGAAVRANAGGKVLADFIGNKELRVFGPAIDFLGELDFVGSERCAVSGVGMGLIWRAVADNALEDNDRRLVGHLFGRINRPLDRAQIVGVIDAQ